jgi:hypothetical protein
MVWCGAGASKRVACVKNRSLTNKEEEQKAKKTKRKQEQE